MYYAELNIPKNHVYLFKPQSSNTLPSGLFWAGEYGKIAQFASRGLVP